MGQKDYPTYLLVFVQLLQVIGGHGVNTVVLSTIDIVLVTENTGKPMLAHIHLQLSRIGNTAHQMLMPGRGMTGNLTVPEKRLSRWGS